MAKEVLLRQLAKAALNAGTYVTLNGEVARTAQAVAGLGPKMVAADPPWSLPDGLPLYCCLSPDVRACLWLLSQDSKFAGTHSMRQIHCWGKPYCTCMRKMVAKWFCIADAYSRGALTAPPKIKHCNAKMGVFAARTSNKGSVAGPYHRTIVYRDLFSRQSM